MENEFISLSEEENVFIVKTTAINFHFSSSAEANVLVSSIPNKMTVSKNDEHITFSFNYPFITEELPVGVEYKEGNLMVGKYTGTLKKVSASNILIAQVLILRRMNEYFRLGAIGNMNLCLLCLSSYHHIMSTSPEDKVYLYPQFTTRDPGKRRAIFRWWRGY